MEIEKKKKGKLLGGFTINEVLITTGIIVSLTAIAIPNYLRMRMNVNMELVKQSLKVIGQNMNDLFNKNQQFPEDITKLGNSEEEVAITASLFAIDKRDYTTTNGYQTLTNRAYYQFRTCPKEGKWGTAGDKCFLLTPMGVSTIEPWDGQGIPMLTGATQLIDGLFSTMLGDKLSTSKIGDLLTVLFKLQAYQSALDIQNKLQSGGCPGCPSDWMYRLPSNYFVINQDQLAQFKQYLPAIADQLHKSGIDMYASERTSQEYTDGAKTIPTNQVALYPGMGTYSVEYSGDYENGVYSSKEGDGTPQFTSSGALLGGPYTAIYNPNQITNPESNNLGVGVLEVAFSIDHLVTQTEMNKVISSSDSQNLTNYIWQTAQTYNFRGQPPPSCESGTASCAG